MLLLPTFFLKPSPLTLVIFLLFLPQAVVAASYNWTFTSAPRQCANLSISVTGNFLPPLKALIVPVGPSPLNFEVRKVIEVPFRSTTALDVSFQLPYPTGSKFNGFVTDAAGYFRGVTGIIWTVQASDDSSCFDSTKNVTSLFTFSLSPPNLAECKNVTISWDPSTVQGTPSFLCLIPGGGYREITPNTEVIPLPNNRVGFIWLNPIIPTIDVIIIGGDNRGMGSGGFINKVVEKGDPSRDSSGNCNAMDTVVDNSRNDKVNIGAVVGGVVVSVVVLVILLFLLHWWLRQKKKKEALSVVDLNDVQNIQIYEGNYTNDNLVYGQTMQQQREEPRSEVEMETGLQLQQPPAYTTTDTYQAQSESRIPSASTAGQRVPRKSLGPFVQAMSGPRS